MPSAARKINASLLLTALLASGCDVVAGLGDFHVTSGPGGAGGTNATAGGGGGATGGGTTTSNGGATGGTAGIGGTAANTGGAGRGGVGGLQCNYPMVSYCPPEQVCCYDKAEMTPVDYCALPGGCDPSMYAELGCHADSDCFGEVCCLYYVLNAMMINEVQETYCDTE